MEFTYKSRRYIFLAFVLFIIVGISTAKVLGAKQDEKYLTQYTYYQQAQQLVAEANYTEADKYLHELLLEQPNSEALNYLAGLTSANLGDFGKAAILMQKTLDINPYKVEDAMFMLQFGEILLNSERYEDAKIVLTRCKEMGWVPEQFPDYQQRITELLAQIEELS